MLHYELADANLQLNKVLGSALSCGGIVDLKLGQPTRRVRVALKVA